MPFAVPLGDELAGLGIDGAGVAAADVDAEGHAGAAFDKRVVRVNGALKVSLGIFAARAHSVERDLVDVRRVARRVNLDIPAAGLYQFGDHLPFDLNHVIDEVVETVIDV